jgi:predicted RNA-binding protein with PIN domain
MLTIIVDGYNFIFNSYFKVRFKSDELQKLREKTINFLSKYYNVKRNKVVVVFDGYNTDEPFESKYNRQNIEIIYSKKDEKADDVIVRLAKSITGSLIIVTNDNDIRRRASGSSCSCLDVDEFIRLAENIIAQGISESSTVQGGYPRNIAEDGEEEECEDGIAGRRGGGEKKGNPRRLSKKERLKMKKIKKL